MWLGRLVLWVVLSVSVEAQIRILTPDSLAAHFSTARGVINGGTSVFGAPYFGKHVLGRLRGLTSQGKEHCSEKDYELTEIQESIDTKGERMHDILVVEHGTWCSACKKVRIAQAKGAHAVILIDPSDDSEKQVQEKILGDDGWGQEVKIPSILVSKRTGERLFAAMRQEMVVVELAWDIPQSQVASVDFWWSSGSREAMEFLQRFQESAMMLGHRMQFVPHYYVFDVPLSTANAMGDLCTSVVSVDHVRHCAPDPDGPGPITGADVANEDVRQLCLWHKTAVAPDPATDGLYSESWWYYVTELYDSCPFDEDLRQRRFGSKKCSYELMMAQHNDISIIDNCIHHHADDYLAELAREGAWSEQALRINGWRYTGPLDPEIVLQAVCSSFASPVPVCEELLNGWYRRSIQLLKHRVGHSMSKNTFTWLLSGICILSVLNCYLYRKYLMKLITSQMREEVMLEVQCQMADYAKLGADGDAI